MNINPFNNQAKDKGKRREPRLSEEAHDLARKLDSLKPGIYVAVISKEENGPLKPAVFELGNAVHLGEIGERLFRDRFLYPELEEKMKAKAQGLLEGTKGNGQS